MENADEGMRIWNQRGGSGQTWQVLDAVRKIADGHGVSMAQVAIAWVLARPAVCAVILGARSLEQFTDNLAADSEGTDQAPGAAGRGSWLLSVLRSGTMRRSISRGSNLVRPPA